MRILKLKYKGKSKKKDLKRLRKIKRVRGLIELALELNKNLPASEVWFHEKFNNEVFPRITGRCSLGIFEDIKNEPFFDLYIPDVINHGYKYIIEIDGSVHETLKQSYKDLAKDKYYKKRHYKVFRVKAYDDASYLTFISELKAYIETQHKGRCSKLFNEGAPGVCILINKSSSVNFKPGVPKTILRKSNV